MSTSNTPASKTSSAKSCRAGISPNKWILFASAGFQALTSSVVIFGWPNIEPVLVDKGIFLDRCDPDKIGNTGSKGCDAQIEALALIFTVASAVSFAFNLFNGMMLDRFGVKATVAFGLGLFSLGLIVLGLGSHGVIVDVDYNQSRKDLALRNPSALEATIFFLGFSLIGAAAVATLHPTFSVGSLFPRIGNSVVTTINGCADSSAVMFLFVRLLYFSGGIALHHILYGYVIGPMVVCFLFTVLFWPRWPFRFEQEIAVEGKEESLPRDQPSQENEDTNKDVEESASAKMKEGELETIQVEEDKQTHEGGSSVALGTESNKTDGGGTQYAEMINDQFPHLGKEFKEQVLTFRFLGGAMFTWINILKFNYFFVTLNIVLEEMGDTDGTYTEIFGWISLGGLGAVFVTGTIIERYGLVGGFWGSNISGILLSVLSLIPILELQILTFIVFVIFRSFLFSIAATFLASEFGNDNFGKLMGTTFCIGGGIGFLSQALLTMGLNVFDRDFTVPSLLILAVTLLQTTFPVLYTCYKRKNVESVDIKE